MVSTRQPTVQSEVETGLEWKMASRSPLLRLRKRPEIQAPRTRSPLADKKQQNSSSSQCYFWREHGRLWVAPPRALDTHTRSLTTTLHPSHRTKSSHPRFCSKNTRSSVPSSAAGGLFNFELPSCSPFATSWLLPRWSWAQLPLLKALAFGSAQTSGHHSNVS